MRIDSMWVRSAAIALLIPLAACDGLLDVEAPGRIADDDLNSFDAINGIVAGMSADLTEAYDATLQDITIFTDELFHGGSYDFGNLPSPTGEVIPEDVNAEWAEAQQARFVAENGIERIRNILDGSAQGDFNSSRLVARAYLLAGFSNRFLGENFCRTVIDAGEAQPNTIHFPRAEEHFSNAIAIGMASGADEIVEAAYAGRASVRAWQGNWSGAVADASLVSDDFVYYAIFNPIDAALNNDLAFETHSRKEFTVFNTPFEAHPDDPRIPWDTIFDSGGEIQEGEDGQTPFYQQNKYIEIGDDVPLVSGPEMLILQAEAALRDNQTGTAYTFMNEARAEFGMDPLTPSTDINVAWDDLHFERGATLWLEGRRMWDLRRWFEAGPGAPEYNDFFAGRDTCFPISQEELDSNPNL